MSVSKEKSIKEYIKQIQIEIITYASRISQKDKLEDYINNEDFHDFNQIETLLKEARDLFDKAICENNKGE